MKAKNPHAVALGRKGGKKTGRKGFAAMEPEKAKRIRRLAAFVRKAMMEPDERSFAYAISDHWFCTVIPEDRCRGYNIEFVRPLVATGYLVESRTSRSSGFIEHFYRPTMDGLRWWAKVRIAGLVDIDERYRPPAVATALLAEIDQKPAGELIQLEFRSFFAGLRGILDGLLTFTSYFFTPPHGRSEEYLTVRLTKRGEAYWRSTAPPLGEW